MPRWAKIAAGVSAGLVALMLGVLVVGGAQDAPAGHGPGNHMAPGGGMTHGGNHTRPATGHHGSTNASSNGTRGPVTWTVHVQDNAFASNNLTIQVGDTIQWTHSGSNPHTVTANDGSFDSHPNCANMADSVLGRCMQNGATFNRTFDKVGKVEYRCKLHSDMQGVVHVLQTYHATPGQAHHGEDWPSWNSVSQIFWTHAD